MNTVIAIDGPSASGKSTVAKKIAQELLFLYVDTGAMYRSFTWHVLQKGVDPSDSISVASLVSSCNFDTIVKHGTLSLSIDGQDPAPYLRQPEIHNNVSKVATVAEVREFLVTKQRSLRNISPLVMEGRDIGTVVFTDTPLKFFIDCDPDIRAQRRAQQGEMDATAKRDEIDRNRQVSPLIKAADAELIDSGKFNADEITQQILKRCKEKNIQPKMLSLP